MAKYINVDRLRNEVGIYIPDSGYLNDYQKGWNDAANLIWRMCEHAADIAPVRHGVIELTYEEYAELCSYALADEQNHGEWRIDKSGSLMCSKCGTLLDEGQKPSRYCPNCGARMDESTMGQVKRRDAVNEEVKP